LLKHSLVILPFIYKIVVIITIIITMITAPSAPNIIITLLPRVYYDSVLVIVIVRSKLNLAPG
jgi:hypothetical protein